MKQTQETKKCYRKVKCSVVTFWAKDVLTYSVDTVADEVNFDKGWLD